MTGLRERRRAVDAAIGSVRLSGGEPSDETKAIMEQYVNGGITALEMVAEVQKNYYILKKRLDELEKEVKSNANH